MLYLALTVEVISEVGQSLVQCWTLGNGHLNNYQSGGMSNKGCRDHGQARKHPNPSLDPGIVFVGDLESEFVFFGLQSFVEMKSAAFQIGLWENSLKWLRVENRKNR